MLSLGTAVDRDGCRMAGEAGNEPALPLSAGMPSSGLGLVFIRSWNRLHRADIHALEDLGPQASGST